MPGQIFKMFDEKGLINEKSNYTTTLQGTESNIKDGQLTPHNNIII